MKRLCFLIFMFFISCFVYANEIDIKDISLVNSSDGIKLNNDIAIFNNKDQSIKYKITLFNNLDYDIKIDDININNPNDNIFSYKLSNINKNDIFKSNEELIFYIDINSNNISKNYLNNLLNINIKYRDFSSDDKLYGLVKEKPSNNDKLKISTIIVISILFITIFMFIILRKFRVNKNKTILIMFFLLVSLFFSSSNLYNISYSNKYALESSINISFKYNNIKLLDNEFCIYNECFTIIDSDKDSISGINIYNLNDNSMQDEEGSINEFNDEIINQYKNLLFSYGINSDVSVIEYKEDSKLLIKINKEYLMEE